MWHDDRVNTLEVVEQNMMKGIMMNTTSKGVNTLEVVEQASKMAVLLSIITDFGKKSMYNAVYSGK